MVFPASISPVTPEPAPTIAPLPIVVWSLMDALPPIITPSPKVTDPANPEFHAMIQNLPKTLL